VDIITLDYESYWASDYSMTSMSPLEYVLGDKFEVHSCTIKFNGHPSDCFFGHGEVQAAFKRIKNTIESSILVAHNNAGFDAYISAFVFGLRPRMWGCTQAMARPLHAKTVGLSLAKLVEHYGIGVKNNAVLLQTKGKRLADFTPQELRDMETYNKADTDQCYALFNILKQHFTPAELWQIDALIRMRVEPKFEVDTGLLKTALSVERSNKHKALMELAKLIRDDPERGDWDGNWANEDEVAEYVRSELASAPKFSAILTSRGVDVPMKPSPTNPEKQVPALAKTDEAFTDLQQHDDEIVAAAARARLAVKSTLLETRIEKFLTASDLTKGLLPVPLRYAGADTTGRDSGEEYNPQNLPRLLPGKPKVTDALRNCMRAPKGYKVIVADLSGIEMRVNHFLWKVQSTIDLYQADPQADLYRAAGATLHQCTPEEVTKPQRQVEKVKELGLGFGAGPPTFQRVAKLLGGLDITLEESTVYVTDWRVARAPIVEGWKQCGEALKAIRSDSKIMVDPWGLVTTNKEGLLLPSGRLIRYPDLRIEEDGKWPDGRRKSSFFYAHGRHKARITGPKADENCIAEGTEVLTDSGWKPIERITRFDRVHDGVEFVLTGGLVRKSVQACVSVDGVYMTPDHEVLTNDGWKAADQVEEPFRPDLRGVDGAESRGHRRTPRSMAFRVPLWLSGRADRDQDAARGQARRDAELRVPDQHLDVQEAPQARNEQAPRVRRLQQHVGSLLAAFASSVEELRSAGHRGVRAVVGWVRGVLGGHGALVPARVGLGSRGQQRPVLAGELPVGVASSQHDEQARLDSFGHTGTQPHDWHRTHDALQPAESGLAARVVDRTARLQKPVYDILNCGPRHRFVVRGASAPFIVHNCVQALARDIICGNALDFYRVSKLRPQLRVHDELVYVVPESEAEDLLAALQKIMRTPPLWWNSLVTWSEGDIADTYGAAK